MHETHSRQALVVAEYLQHVQHVCPQLNTQDLAFFAQGLVVQELPPKAFFRQAGEAAGSMAYVAEGLLKAFYASADGRQTNINFLCEGMYAGDYAAFIRQQPCTYSFQCLEYCTLVCFSRTHQESCTRHIPAINIYFRKMVESAFIAYLQRTESLLVEDAQTRYTDFLHAHPDLFRRVSVSDLCSYLGIQRQTLTRIRKKLLHPAK